MRLSGIKRDLPTRQNGHNVIALWRLLFAGSVSYAPHAIPRLPPEGWLGGLALPARTEAADRLIDRLAVAAELCLPDVLVRHTPVPRVLLAR